MSKLEKIRNKFIKKLRSIKLRSVIYFVIIFALILIIMGINVYKGLLLDTLYDQSAGKRWSSDETRYGQVSIFFSEESGISQDKITEYEYNLNKGLIADGYQEADASKADGTALWDDCFSAMGSITVSKDRRSVDAVAIGIGGNFFDFHPMTLVSGNYIPGNTVMKDYVIVDEELAWQLFGSNDIIGQQITLNGVPHYISGVVKRDSGKYVKAAGLNFPTIYCSFESLATYGQVDASVLATNGNLGSMSVSSSSDDEDENGSTDVNTDAKGIICMEIVMPNPVDNYAKNFLIDKLGLNTNLAEVVDNSARFDNLKLLDILGKFYLRSMQLKPVIYPYWENNARVFENIMAVLLLIQIVCAIIAAIMVAYFVVQSYRHRKWTVGGLVQKFLDWKYDVESNIARHNKKWKYF
ncbi:MAG: ABC transporter permease [Butyrivibrio sp.]|nr:ABC transporter permease [Butyrivibrio sp.]